MADPTITQAPNTPAVVTAYPSAINDAAQTKVAMNDALQNRDAGSLVDYAKQVGIDTPQGKALVSTAQEIQSRAKEFAQFTAPIVQAKTDGDRNIAAAKAMQEKADQPLYGQALIAFMMGQKEDAFHLFTGGKPKTTIEYAKDNGNIIEVTTNALGRPLSYFDTKLNRYLTPEEYSDRGGSVTDIDRTFSMKTKEDNRAFYNAAFQKEKEAGNKWLQSYAGHAPKIEFVDKVAGSLKTDLPAEEYAQIIGAISSSFGQANTRNNASTYFNQLSKNAGSAEGQQITREMQAALGLPREAAGKILKFDASGRFLQSDDKSVRISVDQLKQQTDSASLSSETSKNSQTTLDSVLSSKKFQAAIAQKPPQEQARIISQMKTALQFANEIGSDLSNLSSKYEKPSFISLPTSASFADSQAQLKVQMSQHKQNLEQLQAARAYISDAEKYYARTNTLPSPGEISANFVNTPISKEVRANWANQIQKDVEADYVNAIQKRQQAAAPKAQPASGPVAPPTKRPSLAELRKQAGGK